MSRKMKGNLMLLLTALIWGTAFVAQSTGMDHVGPFTYNGIRNLIAGFVLIPVIMVFDHMKENGSLIPVRSASENSDSLTDTEASIHKNVEFNGNSRSSSGQFSDQSKIQNRRINRRSYRDGIVCGIFLFIASSFQQYGISMTTAGKAGFITALYIVIVPVLGIFLHKKIPPMVWLSVAIAIAGFYLLCIKEAARVPEAHPPVSLQAILNHAFGMIGSPLKEAARVPEAHPPVSLQAILNHAFGMIGSPLKENFSIGRGDLLVLCCAFFFSLHILVIDHFNEGNVDGVRMSQAQFFTVAVLSLLPILLTELPEAGTVSGALSSPVLKELRSVSHKISFSGIFSPASWQAFGAAVWSARVSILYTAVMSSGVAYTLQILGQRYTDPAPATLLMSLESVFAALSGWLILHERLTPKELLGCALVFAAVLLAQFPGSKA